MIAKLWANKIIDGNKYFYEVPTGLKEQVRNLLIEKGHENLTEL